MNRTSGNSTGQLILDFHIARAWSKNFFFYSVDSNGNRTPIDVTSYSWEMFIKRYAGDRIKQVSLTVGSGLTMVSYYDNEITADFTSTQTDLEEGEYYYELYNTTLERSYLSQKCYFTYQGPSTPATEADANILITDDTIEVELISTSGGAGTVFTDGTTITGDGSQSNPLVAVGASGALLIANKLGDLTDLPTSRANLASLHDRITVTDKGSGFTPALADFTGVDPLYRCTASFTITLPSDASVAIPVGKTFYVMVMSTYTTTFAAGSGATMETSSGGATAIATSTEQFLLVSVTKRVANTWSVQNGRAPSGSFTEFTLQGFVATYTNMPSGAQEIAAGTTGRYRTKVDLTNFTSIRCGVSFSTAGATNAGFYLEYSTDQSSWTTLGTATGSDLAAIGGTVGFTVSAWITLPAGAKADVWLRGMGVAGDGAADPVIGRVVAQVK